MERAQRLRSPGLRQRRTADKRMYALAMWFFLFYVIFMIDSFVEAPFEYPSHAIPFFFLMGYGLGLIRWHLSPKDKDEQRLVALTPSARKVLA